MLSLATQRSLPPTPPPSPGNSPRWRTAQSMTTARNHPHSTTASLTLWRTSSKPPTANRFWWAYWFKHDLTRISERLQKLHIPFSQLDGAASIRRWNNGEIPVALIHPASAGHGLNLQSGGSAIVWFGLTWSLELYQQTIARLWRQGQTSETVVVQHIVTKDTIDERIMKALSQKEHTQTALIDAVKADLKI